jgi:hypothetical protein
MRVLLRITGAQSLPAKIEHQHRAHPFQIMTIAFLHFLPPFSGPIVQDKPRLDFVGWLTGSLSNALRRRLKCMDETN